MFNDWIDKCWASLCQSLIVEFWNEINKEPDREALAADTIFSNATIALGPCKGEHMLCQPKNYMS